MRLLWTNFNEIWIKIQQFSPGKINVKMSSGKWRPLRVGLNELNNHHSRPIIPLISRSWHQSYNNTHLLPLWCNRLNEAKFVSLTEAGEGSKTSVCPFMDITEYLQVFVTKCIPIIRNKNTVRCDADVVNSPLTKNESNQPLCTPWHVHCWMM